MKDLQRERNKIAVASMLQQKNDSIDVVELAYRLLDHWKLLACLAILFAVVFGVYTSYFVTPMYQATSTIYVLSQRDSAINISDLQIGAALTGDYAKVFRMWEVHEQVISNLNLPYTYDQMNGIISVTNESDTRMLDISAISPSPEEAAAIANEYARVASVYIEENMSKDKPSIMSVALVPSYPVSPNKTKNIIIGILLGFLLGCVIVTVQMLRDDTYKTAEDIRKWVGLPTLAMIPIDKDIDRTRHHSRNEVGKK